MAEARKPHILFVSQKVIDVKTPGDLPNLRLPVGLLREYLQSHVFIPAEKFTGELLPIAIDDHGNLTCELSGSSLGSPTPTIVPMIRVILPLGLSHFEGGLNIRDVFGAVSGRSIDDGGNVQNMLLNILVFAKALSPNYQEFNGNNLLITVATSSDPFERLDSEVRNYFLDRADVYPLQLPDRFAIHLPYEQGPKQGTFSITSEPKQTYESLLNLLGQNAQFGRAFRSATCFVSSDPFFQLLPSHAMAPYCYIINSSTAFRSLVAVSAYGYNALLPMNECEAGEVCKLMLSRALGIELDQTEKPSFPSPLALSGDGIDDKALRVLDSAIDVFSRYNPFFKQARGLAFACPISFGPAGGLVVGMNKEPIACFSSILSEKGEQCLFNEYAFPKSEQIHETGAGDSVAAVLALFNTISPELLINPHLKGREKDHRDLRHLASTVFVSCLSRIVGNILVRTHRTNLTHVKIESLGKVIRDAAEQSVELARNCVKELSKPSFGVIEKWGIQFVMWVPHRVLVPTGVPITIS